MNIDPGHIVLALADLALTAPALGLAPASARVVWPLAGQSHVVEPALPSFQPTRPADQIARLDVIISSAVERARHAERLHCSAHQQVDAADYALQGLKNELASISGRIAGSAVPLRAVPARALTASPRPSQARALAA